MIQVTPVILCGGSGTRLWPLSRTGFPKQFLCLTGQDSLFQQAAKRLAQLGNADIAVSAPLLVTGEDHRFLAAEQLREAGIPLDAWEEKPERKSGLSAEINLFQRLEQAIQVQIDADKAKLTELQLTLNRLEKNRGR